MLTLKNLKVRAKLLLMVGSALFGVVALVTMSLWFLKHDLQREKEIKTRNLVEAAHSVVRFYHGMAVSGAITQAQAQAQAKAVLKTMRYEGKEYFWINDMQPRIVMHPFKTQLEGTDVSQLTDVTGKRFIVSCVEIVRQKGEGFVYYRWPKPGFQQPVQKLSYVKGFAPWGWVVGSGVYLDDVEAVFWASARQYALAGAAVFLLISTMSLVVARNIARTEASLRSSEEKFHKAFHASPDGFTICRTIDGVLLEANDAFLRATGYSREEIVGEPFLTRDLWCDGPKKLPITEIKAATGLSCVAARRRIKSGEVRSVLLSMDRIFLDGAECLILIEHDVTVQKEKERQLLKGKAELTLKHEQLRSLYKTVESVKMDWERTLDCIDDQVIMLEAQGKVQRCNRSAAEFAGLPKDLIVGTEWHRLVQATGMPAIGPDLRSAEFLDQGTGRWYCCTYYPGGADALADSGAVVTVHDMTESKRAALELGKAYSELQLTQSQMLQQEKMASIGQLAAGVAHEINNPTGFVMSNLGTLGKYTERLAVFIAAQSGVIGTLAPSEQIAVLAEQRRQLKIDHIMGDLPGLVAESLEGTERVKVIVQNLKSFSHSDTSQCQLVDLRESIESTINIVWNELKYKVTLTRQYGDLPALLCYPQQLCQVFMNLLVNAAHAIETQGEITVRTWLDGENIHISIGDTGCGIKEEHRVRIFEPFFTTKEVGKGTGLGLSISYNIVKKHGGDITVQSELGKGTVFTVLLPLAGCQTGDDEQSDDNGHV